jgi:small-conductance mechanosensitive channel
MKEKWGESIGAGFSFVLIQLGAIAIIAVIAFAVSAINLIAGIALGVLLLLLFSVIMSTVKTIFVSAIYHNVTGDPVELYNQQFIDNLFETKRK